MLLVIPTWFLSEFQRPPKAGQNKMGTSLAPPVRLFEQDTELVVRLDSS